MAFIWCIGDLAARQWSPRMEDGSNIDHCRQAAMCRTQKQKGVQWLSGFLLSLDDVGVDR